MSERSRLLRSRLDRLARTLRAVDDSDPRSLHRARTASRRIRELLPILELRPDRAKKLNRRLRKVTRRLGIVREFDVLMLLIDELHLSRRRHSAALSRVGVAVSKERDEARKRLFKGDPANELKRVSKRLRKVIDSEEAKRPSAGPPRVWRWAIDARVARRAATLHDAIDEAGAVYIPERLHVVRVSLKKLRYAYELATELGGNRNAADLRTMKRVQEILGRMRDLQILASRVREVQAAIAPPDLTIWRELDMLVATLDDDCRRLHARFMRVRGPLVALTDKLSARRKGQAATPSSAARVS